MRYRLLAVAAALFLAGCATQPAATITRPVVRNGSLPPQASADWINLGVSPNGNILNELDKLSILRNGQKVTFRDRKTIFNLRKENFLNTPRHKISLNYWEIDCANRTFKLTAMDLFDENGRQISSFSYNDAQIKPMPVVQNSASYQQMLVVCGKDTGN
ncbi:surface-adhesin E family protein [Paludibacterium paludis]|uniref:Surface-adhesin protein E-like domain-containing protein n=1 Tax=Paludibacterium paludis TaxID=1225769 RepID=A0A918UBY3_9NEIS|nr:surface-adhesin E family protein [Paludibacterium paludis]GGY29773.1 hypothetical protein GCM10011289_35850 [Paludibacterium paludis]